MSSFGQAGSNLSDQVVRQFLISRNYSHTLKSYDQELKQDKNRNRFQAHKLVDALLSCVLQTDLTGLRDQWQSLDFCFFRYLDNDKKQAASVLKHNLYKSYLVEAVRNKHHDKVQEFFELLAMDLQLESPDWKDWLCFPYVRNYNEHKVFSMYFTRNWTDIFILSLHNFLALVLASSTKPMLHQIDAIDNKAREIARENKELRKRLHANLEMQESARVNEENAFQDCFVTERRDPQPLRNLDPSELIEDFTTIGSVNRKDSSSDVVITSTELSSTTSRGFVSSVIRKISSPSTTPLFSRKKGPSSPTHVSNPATAGVRRAFSISEQQIGSNRLSFPSSSAISASSQGITSSAVGKPRLLLPPAEVESGEERSRSGDEDPEFEIDKTNSQKSSSNSDHETKSQLSSESGNRSRSASKITQDSVDASDIEEVLLELGQERLAEHHTSVSHVKFSRFSSLVASLDASGCLFVWESSPTPNLIHSASSRGGTIFSFDWCGSADDKILIGNKNAGVRTYNIRTKSNLSEILLESEYPKIHLLESFATGDKFVCGSLSMRPSSGITAGFIPGKLSVYNTESLQLEMQLLAKPTNSKSDTSADISTNTCCTDHDTYIILSGGSDGIVRLYDIRVNSKPCSSWQAHSGAQCVSLASRGALENSVYSLGTDGNFCLWNLSKTSEPVAQPTLHKGVGGPFQWVKEESGFKQEFLIPKGKIIKLNPSKNALITCNGNSSKIYRLSQPDVALPWIELKGHKSPVISLDWFWGEGTVTCLTGSMDGSILINNLMTTNK